MNHHIHLKSNIVIVYFSLSINLLQEFAQLPLVLPSLCIPCVSQKRNPMNTDKRTMVQISAPISIRQIPKQSIKKDMTREKILSYHQRH